MIAQTGKDLNVHQQMNKYTEYGISILWNIAVIKRNEILMHTTTWMKYGNKLSQRKQAQKASYCMIAFILNIQNKQNYRDRISGCLVLRSLGVGEMRMTASSYRVS